MAHQGFNKYERTFGLLVFYRVKDRYYVRKKSQLSGKRVKTAEEFVNSMASANRLKTASRIASTLYKQLPDGWKLFELYQKLTGIGARLLKEGKTITEIRPMLEQQLYDWGYRKEIEYPVIKPSIKFKVKGLRRKQQDSRDKAQVARDKAQDSRIKAQVPRKFKILNSLIRTYPKKYSLKSRDLKQTVVQSNQISGSRKLPKNTKSLTWFNRNKRDDKIKMPSYFSG